MQRQEFEYIQTIITHYSAFIDSLTHASSSPLFSLNERSSDLFRILHEAAFAFMVDFFCKVFNISCRLVWGNGHANGTENGSSWHNRSAGL